MRTPDRKACQSSTFVQLAGTARVLRSAINRRHDPIGVPLPRYFFRRQSFVEHLHLRGIKLDGLGGHILLKIFPALGAGDRYDVVALLQQPGKRDLPALRAFSRRDLAYYFRRFHVGAVVRALVA
jgi:hypothetical protein